MDASPSRLALGSGAAAAGAPRFRAAGALGRARGHPGALGVCRISRSEGERVDPPAGRATGARASDTNIGGDDERGAQSRSKKQKQVFTLDSRAFRSEAFRFARSAFRTFATARSVPRRRTLQISCRTWLRPTGVRPAKSDSNEDFYRKCGVVVRSCRLGRPTPIPARTPASSHSRFPSSCPPSPPPLPQPRASRQPAHPRSAVPDPRRVARFLPNPPPLAPPCAPRPSPWNPRRMA